jgi:NAD-dependent dihydropyrimidine dehydrogenase PreA subunit
MARRISVVVSQGQSQNPVKRTLEEVVVTALMIETHVDVTVIPHLYDLAPAGTGVLALSGIPGDLVVISWLYERAARWTLDRNGIRGQAGYTELATRNEEDDAEDEGDMAQPATEQNVEQNGDGAVRVNDTRDIPLRKIYCLELTTSLSSDEVLIEVRRIATESSTQVVELMDWVGGKPTGEALQRFQQPQNDTALAATGGKLDSTTTPQHGSNASPVQRVEESAERRWYPVIDFSRCTNCMECIDFCLFGVYGIDGAETILVEQPDNCRKGCPACSRVCPENAIIFPQHKTPAIAGAPVAAGTLKIDLSKLFGAPDAVEIAAQERDEQLVLAGRDAVGLSIGIPKRQTDRPHDQRDDLDDLIDGLDDLDV